MKKVVNQFAVVKDSNGVVQKIGKSSILQPKPCFCGKSTKWFDDTKLMRKEVKK